eukprot:TRINITY_DN11540_c0_g1_i1.p1 TRINITY_DN11540_c0_g1~~TRINITY_DN11540_c0_g1_i1.p1  ORF type:complete len:329 (+),score=99.36 TRINITY_DN11540_c0_g1_i1:100-1086(+)
MAVTFGSAFAGLSPIALVGAALVVFGGGVTSGMVGIGGVVIVPILVAVGVDTKIALGSTMAAFALASFHAVRVASGVSGLKFRQAVVLASGAGGGAAVSSFVVLALPREVLQGIVAVLGVFSGVRVLAGTLRQPPEAGERAASADGDADDCESLAVISVTADGETSGAEEEAEGYMSHEGCAEEGSASSAGPAEPAEPAEPCGRRQAEDAAIGVVGGFGSGVSGTAGPFVLLPLLLLLRPEFTPQETVALCFAAGIPIGILSSIGYFTYGEVDVVLGLVVAVLMSCGLSAGIKLAGKVSPRRMRMVVAVGLTSVGTYIAVRIAVTAAT